MKAYLFRFKTCHYTGSIAETKNTALENCHQTNMRRVQSVLFLQLRYIMAYPLLFKRSKNHLTTFRFMSGSSLSCNFKGAQLDSEKNIEATIMQFVQNLKPIFDRIGARNRELMNPCSRRERRNQNLKKTNWHTNENKQVQRKTVKEEIQNLGVCNDKIAYLFKTYVRCCLDRFRSKLTESVYGLRITNEPLYPVTRHFPHILRGIKLQNLIKGIEQQEIQQ